MTFLATPNPRRACVLILLVVTMLTTTTVAQHDKTVPEVLAHAGKSITRRAYAGSGPAPSVADILSKTDLVVKGRVAASRSHLTDDQKSVVTDLSLANPAVLYQREVVTSTTPGNVSPITVTVPGGAVTINGLTFTYWEGTLPTLEPGTDALFLLKREGTQYVLAGEEIYGVFRFSDGRLVPHTRKQGFAADLANRSAADAEEEIVTEARRLRN